MSDPTEERLRFYYGGLPSDPPVRLETSVARALETAPKGMRVDRPIWRTAWRPAFGVTAAGAAVLIVALVFRGLGPAPGPSGSIATSESASPTPSASATATATSGLGTVQPGPTLATSSSASATGSPLPSASESPTASPTLRPAATALRSDGNVVRVGLMAPFLSGPAVRLQDATVLIVGGMTVSSGGLQVRTNLAEIYHEGSHSWDLTGSMADVRVGHTATLLEDGRVLVVGGTDFSDGTDNLASAEIYGPLTAGFTRTGSMAQGRANHTASLLVDLSPDRRVLIAGGVGGGTLSLRTAELYDPGTGQFSATGSMTAARQDHTSTVLPDGRVLITGGIDDNSRVLASAELYDPAKGTFTATGTMTSPRAKHTATALYNGTVLITGGVGADGNAPLASAEIYDPTTGTFTATGSMGTARYSHTATELMYGQVIVAGGPGTDSLEVYWPDTGRFGYERALLGPAVAAATYGDRVLFTGNGQMYCSWPASFSPCL